MQNHQQTRKLLTEHYKKYPLLQIQDIFKFLHQSVFGCSHLVTSSEEARKGIEEELKTVSPDAPFEPEQLDGRFCRLPLAYINHGLDVKTFSAMFFLSAKEESDGEEALTEKLEITRDLITEGILPFDAAEFDSAVALWREQGFPAVRHSDRFKDAYSPAYRVISMGYVPYLTALATIDSSYNGCS
jgi:hypothetical protein